MLANQIHKTRDFNKAVWCQNQDMPNHSNILFSFKSTFIPKSCNHPLQFQPWDDWLSPSYCEGEQFTPKCQCWVSQLALQPPNWRRWPAANGFCVSSQSKDAFWSMTADWHFQSCLVWLPPLPHLNLVQMQLSLQSTEQNVLAANQVVNEWLVQRLGPRQRNLRQPSLIFVSLDGRMIFALHSQLTMGCFLIWFWPFLYVDQNLIHMCFYSGWVMHWIQQEKCSQVVLKVELVARPFCIFVM